MTNYDEDLLKALGYSATDLSDAPAEAQQRQKMPLLHYASPDDSTISKLGSALGYGVKEAGQGIYEGLYENSAALQQKAMKGLNALSPSLVSDQQVQQQTAQTQQEIDRFKQEHPDAALATTVGKVLPNLALPFPKGGIPAQVAAGLGYGAVNASQNFVPEGGSETSNYAQNMALGAAAGAIPASIGAGVIKNPEAAALAQKSIKEAGFQPTLGSITDSAPVRGVEDFLAKVPGVGTRPTYAKNFNKAMDLVKSYSDPKAIESLTQTKNKLYDDFDTIAVQLKTPIKLTNFNNTLNTILHKLRITLPNTIGETRDRYNSVITSLKGMKGSPIPNSKDPVGAISLPEAITPTQYTEAHGLLNPQKLARERTITPQQFKEMRSILSEQTTSKIPIEKQTAKTLLHSLMDDITEYSTTTGNPALQNSLKAANDFTNNVYYPQVVIDGLVKKSTNGLTNQVSLPTFIKNFNRSIAKKELNAGSDVTKKLQGAINIIKQVQPKQFQVSPQTVAMMASMAVGFGLAGNVAMPVVATGVIGTVSKALTNPAFQKYLIKASSNKMAPEAIKRLYMTLTNGLNTEQTTRSDVNHDSTLLQDLGY